MADSLPSISADPLMMYNWMCPYVHRVTLALAHKKAEVKLVDIDLANKPPWLPTFSPHGKVPAITYEEGGQQQVLYESMVLMQWVEDYFGDAGRPELLPGSPAAKAKARIIMARFDAGVVSGAFYKLVRCSDVDSCVEVLKLLKPELEWLEGQMDEMGPFMMGSTPTMVDAACAPWLLRAFVVRDLRQIDILWGFAKLNRWLQAYSSLPEVMSTIRPPPGKDWAKEMTSVYSHFYAGGVQDFSKAMALVKW